MEEINNYIPGVFKNKWSFVDAFSLLLDSISRMNQINSENFAILFDEFNEKRVEHRHEPEIALRSRTLTYGKELYNYILAFEKEAAKRDSLLRRKTALESVFENIV